MRVLAVSVHPDDETLGCGGTLLRHAVAGDELFWLVVTQAHEPQWSRDVIEAKAAEVDRVALAYGMQETVCLGLPTVKLDTVDLSEIITGIREAIERIRPEVIYTVHEGDIHSDHFVTFRSLMSVLKPFYMSSLGVRRILSFETLSSTDAAPSQIHRVFLPTMFVDISDFIDRKIEIMAMFETETHGDHMPRGASSIRALARHRGATMNTPYAEAFSLIREIW